MRYSYLWILLWLSFFHLLGCKNSPSTQTPQMQPPPDSISWNPVRHQKSSPIATETKTAAQLWYRLELQEQYLQIRVRLQDPGYEGTHFYIPTAMQGGYGAPWQEKLYNFQAFDPQGHPLKYEYQQQNRSPSILIYNKDMEYFEVSYQVSLQNGHDVAGTLVLGPSIFIVPSRETLAQTTQIPIEVVIPKDYGVVTSWQEEVTKDSHQQGYKLYGYIAPSPRELRDSYLFVGRQVSLLSNDAGTRRMGFSGRFSTKDQKQIYEKFSELVSYYETVLGSLSSYTGLIRRLAHGQDVLLEPAGMGRLNGFIIQIEPRASIRNDNFSILLAHEALHMWNGHALHASPESMEENLWLIEGVTQYLALKAARQLGWIDQNRLKVELNLASHHFLQNPLLAKKPGTAYHKARFPYDHGTLLGYYLDCVLHSRDQSTLTTGLKDRELEGWLRVFMSQQSPLGYTTESIFKSLDTYGKQLQQEGPYYQNRLQTLKHYISQPLDLDPKALFEQCPMQTD